LVLASTLGMRGPGIAALAAEPAGADLAPTARGASSLFQAATWGTTTGTELSLVRDSIGANTSLTKSLTGAGVGIAMIDTGVAPVPGLPKDHIINGPDLSFESQDPDLRYLDSYGHGTHLAGIMVGNDPATGFRGIAPGAKLTSIKVATSNGAVDVTQVVAAIDWTVAHRNDDPANPIKLINLAYGVPNTLTCATDPLCGALENARLAGIVTVVAAGNTGTATNLPSPGRHKWAVTVGSVGTKGTASPADDVTSPFTAQQAGSIDLMAPGESIVSLRNPGSYIDQNYPTARVGTDRFRGSGTSQSTAVVTGAMALIMQKFPSLTPTDLIGRTYAGTIFTNPPLSPDGKPSVEINVDQAIRTTTSGNSCCPTGSLPGTFEQTRGPSHAMQGTVALTGEKGIFGPLSYSQWAQASYAKAAWKGGSWMGVKLAGDGWTGTSWASKTWAGTSWTFKTWAGTTWDDPDWQGRYWSNGSWSGRYWSGRYWSSDNWATASWR
jgi:serine protease AprX